MCSIKGASLVAVSHRSVAPGLKLGNDYVRRVFHPSIRLIAVGGRSAHLAYIVRKICSKTETFIFDLFNT